MIRRVYIVILFVFIGGIAVLNISTFFADMEKRQLYNFFYLPERANAIMMLGEHVVFESGLVIKKYTENEIRQVAEEVCAGTNVSSELAMAVIKADGKLGVYSIHFNGSVGLMHLSPKMLRYVIGMDPFLVKDNIQIGVTHLSMLIDQGESIDIVLRKYFALPERANVFARDVNHMNKLAEKAFEYYELTKPTPPPPSPYDQNDLHTYDGGDLVLLTTCQ